MTTPTALVVEHETFTAIAGLRGGAGAVSVLRAGQISKRMLLLAAVRRTSFGRAPSYAYEAGLEHAYRLLAELQARAPDVWAETILHPYLDAWAARCLRALDPRNARSAQDHPADLGYLAPLVARAAAQAGLAHLVPGALRPWPADALTRVRLERQGIPLALCIDDRDPMRGQYGRALAGPLSARETAAWQSRLAASWDLLTRHHRIAAEAVAACLTRVVPLCRGPGEPAVSSAARRAYGAVAASLPSDPEILAVTLVHEFLHVQLGALLDLMPLYHPDRTPRYKAAWHPAERPVGALLQGAYAHLGVTAFWRTQCRVSPDRAAGERAQWQYARQRSATADALHTLLTSERLTDAGEVFVSEMARVLEAW